MYGFGNMNVKPVPHPSLCNPDSYIHITHYTELISTGILQFQPSGERKAQATHKNVEFQAGIQLQT